MVNSADDLEPEVRSVLQQIGDDHLDFFYGGSPDDEFPGISRAVDLGLVRRMSCDDWYRYELSNAGRQIMNLPPRFFLSDAIGYALTRLVGLAGLPARRLFRRPAV